ncbi:EntF, Non-ribosomal peptide synthetase modules protein [Pyrenophora tritici-repentis]|nr:EntF, Non-ribosomal peptide synthetase modules protein [Pyrenophora tritici-repentis]
MPVKIPLAHLLQNNATFAEAGKAFGKNLSNVKKHEMYPFLSLIEEARKQMNESQLKSKLAVIANPDVFGDETMAKLQGEFLSAMKSSQQNTSIFDGLSLQDVEAISSSRVHTWIKQRAAAQPNAIALSSAERTEAMTYRELANRSSQVANYLAANKVASGDGVLLHISRVFNTVIWLLGILEAGAYYVVLDKKLPDRRKAAIASISEARFLVTDDFKIQQTLSNLDITVVSLDTVERELSTQSVTLLKIAQRDDDLAHINFKFIFTSGSTGQPKGVMVQHSNLSLYVSTARSIVKLGPGSRVLQFATFAFDASVLEWVVTLSYGATLCFVDHPEEYLATIIEKNKINFFHTTLSVLSKIPVERSLDSLRMISVGGEPSSAGLLGRWRQKAQFLHAFGPTETTGSYRGRSAQRSSASVTIYDRQTFPKLDLRVCSEDSDDSLPIGKHGENCIVGPQVSCGYKGQPELTESRFRTIQLDGHDTAMYRISDKGFLDEHERLHIGGRMKNREIKPQGYRMDLQEIEKSILDHSPEVQTMRYRQFSMPPKKDQLGVSAVLRNSWMQTLQLNSPPNFDTSFFEVGGHSITLTEPHKRIVNHFPNCKVSLLDISEAPTITKQAEFLSSKLGTPKQIYVLSDSSSDSDSDSDIHTAATSLCNSSNLDHNKFAIVGLAGYFPGAVDIDSFWKIVMESRSAVVTHKEALPPGDMTEDEIFEIRKLLFLSVASQALADANISITKSVPNPTGVFIGAAYNTHKDAPGTPSPADSFQARHRTLLGLPISTFTAYKLNLTGPNATLNTACSSSLVALQQALSALRAKTCTAALVGGVTVHCPKLGGYVTAPGQVFSPSGYYRPLDAAADGSVPADTVAAVVIKTLSAARRENEAVYAIIEGCAIGSDGSVDKVGFTVPSGAILRQRAGC